MSLSVAASRPGAVPPGTRFGRYEILAKIASGGMATVYLGRALGAAGFQRLVAIKVMHPHVVTDEEFVDMFLDEARLAARIRHPNVVPTLDLDNGPDGLFLVMEYVEGDSLLGLLRAAAKSRDAIPPMIAIRILLDGLYGLDAAHDLTGDRGEPLRIVHRDISPHNILVGTDGISRITDFGVARADSRVSHTREGQIKGKLSYMAPEQTTGEHVDRRTDIFALGIVLWETLAARRLFKGDSDAHVLRSLLELNVPRLSEISPAFSPAIDAVVARALARRPDDRYASAAEFAEALEAAGAAIGVASTRAVADYVRRLAAPKVAEIQEVVRAFSSADQKTVRVTAASPDATTEFPAPAPPTPPPSPGDSDTAVRIARGQVVIPPTPAPRSSMVPADARDALPVFAASMPPPRDGRALVFVAGAAVFFLLFLVGGLIFALARKPAPAAGTDPPPPTTPAPPPSETIPTIEIGSAPPTISSATTQTSRVPHPTAPVRAHPSARPTATTPPSNGNAPFNPESM